MPSSFISNLLTCKKSQQIN
uniref:Uncharacterized protein n=1 Tax=Anguilla anguilla TaxID=7936 RepID=A0A0E9V7X5_ANGAN